MRELRVQMLGIGCLACVISIGMTLWREFRLWEVVAMVSRWSSCWWSW